MAIDGLHWQEVFRGADDAMANKEFGGVFDKDLVLMQEQIARPTVQIYFHLDSVKVGIDAASRTVRTGDDVGLAMHHSEGLQAELLPGRISESFERERPSTRVRLSDRGGAGHRVYATVLIPFLVTEPVPPVSAVVADDAAVQFPLRAGLVASPSNKPATRPHELIATLPVVRPAFRVRARCRG